MTDVAKLIDKSGLLLTREAMNKGVSKHSLYSFIEENRFEQVIQGVYASPETLADDTYILSLRCPKGIFSHDEALYAHGLIDREPTQRTITVYTGYGVSHLVKDGIKVFTVKKELLSVGKEFYETPLGHKIPIYDRERTICDLVRSRSWFEIQDYQTALKAYIRGPQRDLNKLMEYAQLFHVETKIREYMEVML